MGCELEEGGRAERVETTRRISSNDSRAKSGSRRLPDSIPDSVHEIDSLSEKAANCSAAASLFTTCASANLRERVGAAKNLELPSRSSSTRRRGNGRKGKGKERREGGEEGMFSKVIRRSRRVPELER